MAAVAEVSAVAARAAGTVTAPALAPVAGLRVYFCFGSTPSGGNAGSGDGGTDAAVQALFSTHRLIVSRRGRGCTSLRLRRGQGVLRA